MTIKIESVQIQKLGPLNTLQLDLGMLNLIYGRNESGKTYLTEFLLHSIFRHAKTWNLRDINPEGSVNIQGLGEQTTVFSPAGSKKIEDHWDDSNRGLPLNMARLLVVKGGELALADSSPGGVDRETLKNALTSQALLDQILASIQPTIRKAEIIEGIILGNDKGQINDRNKLLTNLRDLDKLIDSIEDQYSRGPARQIEDKIEFLEIDLDQQLQAKKHQAYLLSKKQGDLQKQREKISDERILSLRDQVRDHNKMRKDRKNLAERISSSTPDIETYRWLESAISIWEEKELENKNLPEKILLVIGGALLSIGLVIPFLQDIFPWQYLPLAGSISSAIGGAILVYFGIQLLKGIKNTSDAGERETIRDTYQEKFDQPLKGITELRAELNNYQEIFLRTKNNREEFEKLSIQLQMEKHKIEKAFVELFESPIAERDWESKLQSIKEQSDSLDADISDLKIKLAKFNLDETDYLSEPQAVDYDPDIQSDLENRLITLKDELGTYQAELDTLKARAIEWTRDEITAPWSDVLHHLRTNRIAINQSQIDLTAEIAAKIGLSEIIRKIKKEEDEKIVENINTDEVSNLMEKITGKYHSLNMKDDQIYVSDPYQEFPLRDLSTGAREQIQLALRLGIASHVSGGEPLFIILDDAFQHSDWDRRDILVKETVDLAKKGWQIIYLTMDDHIRDLFLKEGKAGLKDKFKYLPI